MEVGREGPHELDRSDDVGVAEPVGELFSDGVVALAQRTGERAHLLDLLEQIRPDLTHEGVAELDAQPADVASKGGVELIEIVGHDPNLPKSGGSLTV